MVVMMPCLVVFSFLLGMTGGAVVASSLYDIPRSLYIDKTLFYLEMGDILGGLLKAVCFGVLVSVVSCHYGMATTGGPTGLGRNIMVSVVSCIVTVVLADALLTAFLVGL
jgi:phospholipid/cholesterol/gamma-HCH transport system permease protein